MKAVVFSGTGDGRRLCGLLAERGYDVTVCVATEYGASLVSGIQVLAGRLEVSGMCDVIRDCDIVIDATHPYAEQATKNIRQACEAEGKKYLRLVREETDCRNCVYVADAAEAAEYLFDKSGDVFVSTGSKELCMFELIGSRVRARVLDTDEVHEKCRNLKIRSILFKMPPFSYEDNLKDFSGCRYLVTKDSGKVGGTDEKLRAAKSLGMEIVMIRRPGEGREGYTLEELENKLQGDSNDIDNRGSV